MVVLGLVSTKVPDLEKVDDLKRRIDEAAKYLSLDQLAISPQCGFASDVVGNRVTQDDPKAASWSLSERPRGRCGIKLRPKGP